VLSLFIPSQHATLYDHGEFIGCTCSLGFVKSRQTRHSQTPIIRFRWANDFAASLVRYLLWPVELLAPPGGSDRELHPANGDFYARAFDALVTLHVVGYDYGGI
jgi:hypothetical protein